MSTASPTTVPATPAKPQLGFASLEQEHASLALPVSGTLPPWLSGSLLRTGPSKFEIGGRALRHWFDGLAMLHRFTIGDGEVDYGNRFLGSRNYLAAKQAGKMVYPEFATDPCRSRFRGMQTAFTGHGLPDNGNVNVAWLGEQFVAMTETPLPVQFDAQTLEAAGVHPFTAPGQLSTAHPHVARGSGALLNYAAELGRRSQYRFFAVGERERTPRVIGSLEVDQPAYMHSFGLTERWFVLAEFPLVVNPLRLALSGRPYFENYRWKPERGTRFTLVDRITGQVVAGFETDPCFAFHHVNAYEEGGEVIVDLCEYADASVIEATYMENLLSDAPQRQPLSELIRYRLRLDDRSVRRERLADGGLELPRINYGRSNGRPYDHVWGTDVGDSGWFEQIVAVDITAGERRTWQQPDCFPGEPVFVARPGAEDEQDGVLLSVVLDARAGRSMLLVLDAASLEELARAEVPHHIPFGIHGQFART